MKLIRALFPLALGVFLFAANSTPAAVITTDTTIGALDTSYDGADLVVSNCTVTIDGPHGFNSLLVTNGGSLTHTHLYNGNGALYTTFTNEPLTLTGTNPVTLLNSNVSSLISITDVDGLIFYTNDVDFIQINPGDGTTQISRTDTSSIPDGATVLATYTTSHAYVSGLFLTISNDLTVTAGGSINVNGVGYAPAIGTGHGYSAGSPYLEGAGASHGGAGGMCSSNAWSGPCYDNVLTPTGLGSGGGISYAGPGGGGGGRIQITAGGTVSIDGLVSANGANATNSRAGGGSGGSIWITATNFSGNGTLTVNGGAGEPIHGGGGGGGMISVQCATNLFTGTLTAYGGSGWKYGGAGTIFTQTSDPTAFLLVDNNGHAGTNSSFALSVPADFLIRNGAIVRLNGTILPRHLTIATNAVLTGTAQNLLNLSVTGNLTVQTGGTILMDSLGYPGGTGLIYGGYSAISPYPTGGGGHGGIGGIGSTNANGGGTYGSQTSPTTFGGGGGNFSTSYGGAGGGALQLNVTGTLQVDGTISANGGNGSGTGGGGGAGGSLNLFATTFTGSGRLSANGGNGVTGIGGGGGGGRIAITAGSSTFSGSINAAGGSGANYGGAGTIFTTSSGNQQLTLDNAGNRGTNTPVVSANSATLVIRNGARATATSSLNFNHLLINSNGWLVHVPASSLNLTVSGNATLQPGGGFLGDFCGRSGGQGSAYGGAYYVTSPYVYNVCGGGSYGGKGGSSVSNYASGGTGTIADTAGSPIASYSGSGGGGNSPSFGGYGGGFLQMSVGGVLQNDGVISVNGGNGYGVGGGGGGAGGGIYLSVGTLSGSGSISANGGNGANNLGGGGGGGRIAIYCNVSNAFTGTLSALGGGGANWGGAGTIYLRTNANSRALVIADNGGHPGAGTLLNSSSSTDLILRNGSSCYISSSTTFGDLTVGSNSWLIASNGAPSYATITAANVIIQPGGGISADLAGYNAGSSYSTVAGYYSTGPYYQCGGGGHGGIGGYGLSGLGNGGNYFDSASYPGYGGGGGAGYSTYSIGGKGGGVITLTASGTLQVDGTLSANGGNGSGTGGGGGAGGSLKLSCATLTGTGSLNANGGNGVTGVGGGGAGGIIYASFYSNSFSGNLSAIGGGGYSYGGAGTILLRTNTSQTLVLIDNGGHVGMSTPVPSSSSSHVVVRGGAYAYFSSPSSSTLASLLITSNAWLGGTINLTVTGNATIQPGGTIYADGVGSPSNTSGNGLGGYSYTSPYYAGTGGSHGGNGGTGSATSYSTIYGAFDSTTAPSYGGGGGGGYAYYGSIGGSGGNYVRLTVNGTLQLDGTITANGANGTGNGGGGGAGGGIYLTPGTLTGSGSITANGGNGASYGGGGGGGRIAVYYNSNNFTGKMSAFGGGGYAFGGAGTIYTKTNTQAFGQLLLDNADNPGTNTSFDFTSMDVTVQGKAIGLLPASGGTWSAHNLLIRTNGTLAAPASTSMRTLNFNSLTIDAGGMLTADSAGYTAGSGPGYSTYGSPTVRGGAGYGGYGGGNAVNYGKAYGSVTSPTLPGSGGGGYSSGNGGMGGGALNLYVSGTLTVNGRLSANGGDGMPGAGGGSGGSLNLVSINQLAGSGVISANGGSTTGSAGGGGGGRIALTCNSNNFTGQITAAGGNGLFPGGAGTIYTRINDVKTLTVDNGGIAGTNTPLDAVNFSLPSTPFDLNISGAAKVIPVNPLPLVSNLNLAAGSAILAPAVRSNLVIVVSHDANLAGNISVDYLGYAQTSGPGAGTNLSLVGSGGGYGGVGGNSANGTPGGGTYGSASQPTDFGSGGGKGANTLTGGSEGGGALRLSVGGTLNLDGTLSADGNYGWQDDSGGGSGGSLWITANTLTGFGTLSAAGGDGDLWNGGGGGGGRIAIYAMTNLFLGVTNLAGGYGAADGQPGTLFLGTPIDFLVAAQSPTGLLSNTVSYVDVTFNEAVAPASVSSAAFTLTTPAGVMNTASLSASALAWAPSTVRVSFPVQNLLGNYSLQVAAVLTNILGQPLMQAFTGNFTIALPMISGTVSGTNGTPVAGVTVQPNGGLIGAVTDTNGAYAIGVPPGWNGTLTPSLGSFVFVPGTLSLTNVTASLTNQNFLMVTTIVPEISSSLNGTNLSLGWLGIPGVTYQAWASTNLVDWTIYGSAIPGTNGPMQFVFPLDASPEVFFRVSASN